MNLEKLLELVFNNPENISIEYSNTNGKERLIVNGEELINQDTTYDDSEIKEKITNYKAKIEKLNDYIFEKVIDEAEKRNFNLLEMNKGLQLEHYNQEDALYADNVMNLLTELIQEVVKNEIQSLIDTLELF